MTVINSIIYLIAIIVFLIGTILANTDANSASLADNCRSYDTTEDGGEFTPEQMEWLCDRTSEWENAQSETPPENTLTTKQKAYLQFTQTCSEEDCLDFRFPSDREDRREEKKLLASERMNNPKPLQLDWRCAHLEDSWRPGFCSKFRGKRGVRIASRRTRQVHSKSIRREYRMLTDMERMRLHYAMNQLKFNQVDKMSKWDLLTFRHYPSGAPGAHWGPSFLPWHRELLRQFEVALRNEDPAVSLPYWDTTLDWGLPNPKDSVLWTPMFFGNGNGFVRNGPFGNWPTLSHLSRKPEIKTLYRNIADDKRGRLLGPRDVRWAATRQNYTDFTFCDNKRFEVLHGLNHLWVGGFMEPIRQSPNDPVFYLLHTFVDYMWEHFRQTKQEYWDRETEFVTADNLCKPSHAYDAPMIPFNGTFNKDGMSNDYTRIWYNYETRPSCYIPNNSVDRKFICGSEYLFCDTNQNRCRTKVVAGGNCTGMERFDSCFNSICIGGVCTDTRPTVPTGIVSTHSARFSTNNTITAGDVRDEVEEDLTTYPVTEVITTERPFGNSIDASSRIAFERSSLLTTISTTSTAPSTSYTSTTTTTATTTTTSTATTTTTPTTTTTIPTTSTTTTTPTTITTTTLSTTIPTTTTSTTPRITTPTSAHSVAPNRGLTTLPMVQLPGGSYPTAFIKVMIFGPTGPISAPGYTVKLRGINYKGSDMNIPLQSFHYPEHPGLAYVRIRRPERSAPVVHAEVTVTSNTSQPCDVYCYEPDNGRMKKCSGNITLAVYPQLSDPIAYSHSAQAKRYLNIDISRHPGNWEIHAPYLNFMCDGTASTVRLQRWLKKIKPHFFGASKVKFQVLVLDKHSPFQLHRGAGATVRAHDVQFPTRTDKAVLATQRDGVVFMSVRNPFITPRPVRLHVTVARDDGTFCESFCADESGEVDACDGGVTLSRRASESFDIPFTTDDIATNFIGWKLLGHPKRWSHRISPLRFYC